MYSPEEKKMKDSKKYSTYSGFKVNAEIMCYYLSSGDQLHNNSTAYAISAKYMCVKIPILPLSLASWVNLK